MSREQEIRDLRATETEDGVTGDDTSAGRIRGGIMQCELLISVWMHAYQRVISRLPSREDNCESLANRESLDSLLPCAIISRVMLSYSLPRNPVLDSCALV